MDSRACGIHRISGIRPDTSTGNDKSEIRPDTGCGKSDIRPYIRLSKKPVTRPNIYRYLLQVFKNANVQLLTTVITFHVKSTYWNYRYNMKQYLLHKLGTFFIKQVKENFHFVLISSQLRREGRGIRMRTISPYLDWRAVWGCCCYFGDQRPLRGSQGPAAASSSAKT